MYCWGVFTMSIVKSKHASNYVVIPNEIFKQGLSIEAVGLLTYFLSLPHDWVIYKTQLHEQLGIGREKTDRVFKELQNSGYVLTVKGYSKNGQIEYNHIVYDKPYNGEPQTGKPLTVESATINTLLQSKEEKSKEELINYIPNDFLNLKQKENINSLNTKKETDDLGFLEFWDAYGKKDDRKKCERKWKILKQSDRDKIMLHVPKYVLSTPDIQFRKNPYTYLNNESWENEIVIKPISQNAPPVGETETERKIREFKARGF